MDFNNLLPYHSIFILAISALLIFADAGPLQKGRKLILYLTLIAFVIFSFFKFEIDIYDFFVALVLTLLVINAFFRSKLIISATLILLAICGIVYLTLGINIVNNIIAPLAYFLLLIAVAVEILYDKLFE